MALGKELGEFSAKITSSTFVEEEVRMNAQGPAAGFGTVAGTLTFRGDPAAVATQGRSSWRGASYMEDGKVLIGSGEGTWETVGKHKWRIRLLVSVSDGRTVLSDGEVEWATQSWQGKIYEWS